MTAPRAICFLMSFLNVIVAAFIVLHDGNFLLVWATCASALLWFGLPLSKKVWVE
jgi:hypothetical protein